jgi:hypothetical protein
VKENPMNTTPDQTTTTAPTVIDLTVLPGRVVDAVHLAAAWAGLRIRTFNVYTGRGGEVTAYLPSDGPRDVHAARSVFAQLGITEVTINAQPGSNHSTVTADVPALNASVVLVIAPIPTDPTPLDPAGLLADVDARRASTQATGEGAGRC